MYHRMKWKARGGVLVATSPRTETQYEIAQISERPLKLWRLTGDDQKFRCGSIGAAKKKAMQIDNGIAKKDARYAAEAAEAGLESVDYLQNVITAIDGEIVGFQREPVGREGTK